MKKFNQLYPGVFTIMNTEQKHEFASHLKKLKFPTYKFNMAAFLFRDETEFVCLDAECESFRSISYNEGFKENTASIPFTDFIDLLCGVSALDLSELEAKASRFSKSKLMPGTTVHIASREELDEIFDLFRHYGYLIGMNPDRWEEYPFITLDLEYDVIGASSSLNNVSRTELEDLLQGKGEFNVRMIMSAIQASRALSKKSKNPLEDLIRRLGK